MRKAVYVILIVLLSGCSSCSPDPLKYTVSVTLLSGYELEEVGSEWLGLYLVDPIEEDQFIGYCISNRDGAAFIEYDEVAEEGSLSLRDISDKEIFRNIPLNENVNRVIFQENFLTYKVSISNVKNELLGDTLFFSAGSDDLIGKHVKIPSLAGGGEFEDTILAAYHVVDDTGDFELGEFMFKTGAIYSIYEPDTSKKFNSGFAWGIGKWDFLSSFHSGKYHDGVQFPDYYHRLQVRTEAYPAVNQLEIDTEK